MLRLNPKWQTNNKFSTFSLFCMNLNGTAHHIHNVLGNGHTKPCALGPADSGSPLSLKGRKYLLHKFLTHANSVILYPDFVQSTAFLCPRTLSDPDRDGSSGWCKLDCIRQKIQQYLVQSRLVTINLLIGNIHGIHIKFQLLRMDLPTDDRLQVMKYI